MPNVNCFECFQTVVDSELNITMSVSMLYISFGGESSHSCSPNCFSNLELSIILQWPAGFVKFISKSV
jgi:hypothetical protein